MPGIPTLLPEPKRKPRQVRRGILVILTLLLVFSSTLFALGIIGPQSVRIIAVKAPFQNFVGRTSLFKSIDKTLCKKSKILVPKVLLWGESGVGKTETAIAFANQSLKKFSIIYWLDCATSEVLYQSYFRLADQLGIPLSPDTTLPLVIQKTHNYLENSKAKWLLIFDNVEFSLDLPQRGNGAVLITAQDKKIVPADQCLEVPRFTMEESLELVEKDFQLSNGEEWQTFITEFEGLPLALGEGLQYLKNNPFISLEEYLQAYAADRIRVLKEGKTDPRHPLPLLRSIEKSLTALNKISPDAYEWVKICAYLHPDKIPREWIPKALNLSASDPLLESNIANYLTDRAYLRYTQEDKTFSIHRLKQKLLNLENPNQSEQFARKALKLLVDHVRDRAQGFDFENTFTDKDEFRFWEANAVWFIENTPTLSETEEMILLCNGLGNYYTIVLSNWAKAQHYFEKALEIYGRLYENETALKGEILTNLAFSKFFQKEFDESNDLLFQVIKLGEQLGAHRLVLNAYIDLTRNHEWMDQFEKVQHFLEHFEIHSQKFPNCAEPLHRAEYFKWKGVIHDRDNPELALSYLFIAAEENRKFYGEQFNIQYGYIVEEIGSCFYSLENYEKAYEWLRLLEDSQHTLFHTKYHIEIIHCKHLLAKTRFAQKRYKDALTYTMEAKSITEVLYGGMPCMENSALCLIEGDIYSCLGKKKKALKCYEESLSICRKSKGIPLNGMEKTIYTNLGNLYIELGYKEKGLELLSQVPE